MIIYGAGMSGLLAATMLRRFEPVIHEAASELPNNHAALLRFRTDAVSKATGIPFKKVWVQKAVMGEDMKLQSHATIKDQNCYSLKVSGEVRGRSIENLAPGERYIAPPDFIAQLSKGLNIQYSSALGSEEAKNQFRKNAVISTIPMNLLMRMVGWSDVPAFKYKEIATLTADIIAPEIEVYQTIYYLYDNIPAYRASITGNKLIIEFMDSPVYGWENLGQAEFELSIKTYLMHLVGSRVAGQASFENIKLKKQKYGKLVSSTGKMGKEFILAMTDLYGIYSLGRFATWRQILMDDVVKDVKVIEQLIEQRDNYSRRLKIV